MCVVTADKGIMYVRVLSRYLMVYDENWLIYSPAPGLGMIYEIDEWSIIDNGEFSH